MCAKKDNEMADERTATVVEPATCVQGDLKPADKLQFAKWVLKGIFMFFIVSVIVRLYQESSGETLMDICQTGLLPIASFIIGDYFGSKG